MCVNCVQFGMFCCILCSLVTKSRINVTLTQDFVIRDLTLDVVSQVQRDNVMLASVRKAVGALAPLPRVHSCARRQ